MHLLSQLQSLIKSICSTDNTLEDSMGRTWVGRKVYPGPDYQVWIHHTKENPHKTLTAFGYHPEQDPRYPFN